MTDLRLCQNVAEKQNWNPEYREHGGDEEDLWHQARPNGERHSNCHCSGEKSDDCPDCIQ
jgi:hypothetical protein